MSPIPGRFSGISCLAAIVFCLCTSQIDSVEAKDKNTTQENKKESQENTKPKDNKNLAISGTQLKELTDEIILLAVEDEMRRSEAIDGHRIDVDIDNGIVTLSGHVNNLLTKKIAVGLAERIRGVTSVIDELELNITSRKDTELKDDVQSALKSDPTTKGLKIKIDVDRGEVALRGEVPSNGEKTLVGDVAMAVRGIIKLQNNTTVNSKKKLTDKELQQEIIELYKYAVVLNDVQIDVLVKDGVAILNGNVVSVHQKSYADLLAYHAGVKRVDSRGIEIHWKHTNPLLRARRYERISDEDITKAIKRVFSYDPRLLSFKPEVSVKNGNVTLTGIVGHLTAQRSAEQDARHTIGVRYVKNNIRVRWIDKPPTDLQIANFTRDAMKRDPYVERRGLIVECENAHVSLYGLVNTQFEKYHAEWIASRQNGVVHVNDYLAVRKKWKPKSDKKIEKELNEKLKYMFVDPNSQVSATVENGVAILTGSVDTWYMWQVALDQAIAAGAREPHNLIKVRYGLPSGPSYYGPLYYIPR